MSTRRNPAAPQLAITEDEARARATTLLEQLAGAPRPSQVKAARAPVLTLRNLRASDPMGRLAEALCRLDPSDSTTRRLYAQCLIEQGAVVVAIDVLRQMIATLPSGDAEAIEACGLLGRAHKQIFFDAVRPSAAVGRQALAAAVDAYLAPYEADPVRNTWHGVNVLALVSRARREGWTEIAPRIDPATLAAELMTAMLALPPERRDEWTLPTMAEVALGLSLATGNLAVVEGLMKDYLQSEGLQAFQVASTLRQFIEVWDLEKLTLRTPGTALKTAAAVQRARGLVDILRARLLQLPGGDLTLPAARVAADSPTTGPVVESTGQLEAVLGVDGPETYRWWRAGVDAARSVAAVRKRLGQRIGTGFLVRAGDLGLKNAPDELLFMTNHHVVNPQGSAPGIRPDDAEVVFEAVDPNTAYSVEKLLWTSPVEAHDVSLLRLKALPAGVPHLPVSTELPPLPPAEEKKRPRVYVIGYPGGRELSFSFQDNELLDHEGPPTGIPRIEGVCRVHYRAPTEGGSSGSPVFEATGWRVIALHHKGGRFGMPRLNNGSGTYAANEGLAMGALLNALVAQTASGA